jgi:glycosyltransferase involved in cell wall biosynthesis
VSWIMPIKVLHIAGWYRSKTEPLAVPFIKEHFEALNRYAEGYLLHVEVKIASGRLFSIRHERLSDKEESFVVLTSIKMWRVIEFISLLLGSYALVRHGVKGYDIVNFHVGYPNLTYYNIIRRLIRRPLIIIEHWTAFHYEFNMPKGSRKLDRIRNIYRQNFPLMVVSERLKGDIEDFSGRRQEKVRVIPNVVDNSIFYFDPNVPARERTFFMVNHWREIKDPFPVMRAFTEYLKRYPDAKLRIGGYGPLWDSMVSSVSENKLEKSIELLGGLSKEQIADELRRASALLHHADYETFSVVCAEAISCGCPVIVNYLEAIAEFIDRSNGILVKPGQSFLEALVNYDPSAYDRAEIARNASMRFSKDQVGRNYLDYNLEVFFEYSGGGEHEFPV